MKTRFVLILLAGILASCSPVPASPTEPTLPGAVGAPTNPGAPNPTPGGPVIGATQTVAGTEIGQPESTPQPPGAENAAPTQTSSEEACSGSEGFESQKVSASIQCWQNVLNAQPNSFYALYGLTRLYGLNAELQKSVDFGKLALLIAPTLRYKTRILLNMGLAYQNLKEIPSSIDSFNKIIEIAGPDDPNLASAYINLAQVYNYNVENQKTKACEYFTKYLELGAQLKDKSITNMAGQKKFYCP